MVPARMASSPCWSATTKGTWTSPGFERKGAPPGSSAVPASGVGVGLGLRVGDGVAEADLDGRGERDHGTEPARMRRTRVGSSSARYSTAADTAMASVAVPCRMISGSPAARAASGSVWIGFQIRGALGVDVCRRPAQACAAPPPGSSNPSGPAPDDDRAGGGRPRGRRRARRPRPRRGRAWRSRSRPPARPAGRWW